MNILDIMATDVIKVGLKTTLAEASDIMQESKVRHLIVVAKDGDMRGIISDRDLRLAAKSPFAIYDSEKADDLADKVLIEQMMTETPYCVSPNFSVAEVASLMVEHHVSAVPVLQDKNLIGIVTSTDLLKILVTQAL